MAYIAVPGPQIHFEDIVPPNDGPGDALDSVTITPLSTIHTTVTHMPGPHSQEAPQFRGRKIKKFLYEFELQAKSTKLSDAQKCEYIISYCKEKEAKFIQTLPGYESQQWDDLKDELLSYYLSRFVTPDRVTNHVTGQVTFHRPFQSLFMFVYICLLMFGHLTFSGNCI